MPKVCLLSTVLIHVNGATSAVEEAEYFAKIISFDDLFQNLTYKTIPAEKEMLWRKGSPENR